MISKKRTWMNQINRRYQRKGKETLGTERPEDNAPDEPAQEQTTNEEEDCDFK